MADEVEREGIVRWALQGSEYWDPVKRELGREREKSRLPVRFRSKKPWKNGEIHRRDRNCEMLKKKISFVSNILGLLS